MSTIPTHPESELARTADGDLDVSFDIRNPATGEHLARFGSTSAGEVREALERARGAQPAWAARSVADRARVIEAFHRELFAHRYDAARVVGSETGKAVIEATAAEVAVVLDYARFYARHAPSELAPRRVRIAAKAHFRKRVRVFRQPYGVVGVISPWNYPFMLAAGHILPALVSGNAVLFKPSELTTLSGAFLVELLHRAGVPSDVLQVLPGGGETGAALTSAGCDKIFFTGSERTGRAIARACAERLSPYVLELGGSDPAVVLADAPVGAAAAAIAWGRFSNAGQTCVAPKRVYVEAPVYDRFLAALRSEMERMTVGPTHEGAEVGPPINEAQVATLIDQREDALARGARIAVQVDVPAAVPQGAVPFFPPTILVDVPRGARILTEETFGPLLPVIRVRDADEAVRMANDSPYGLAASVWGADRAHARAVAERLDAGAVTVNDLLISAGMAEVPHGGVKASGTGRAHGVAGLEECVQTMAVIEDLLPGVHQPWWFRYSESLARAFDAYLRFEHAPTLRGRLGGLWGLRHLAGYYRRSERP